MNRTIEIAWIVFAVLILSILLVFNPGILLGPALHLRTLLCGLYAFLLFLAPATRIVRHLYGSDFLTTHEGLLYSSFLSLLLSSAAGFLLLTLRLAHPLVFLLLAIPLLLLFRSVWEELWLLYRTQFLAISIRIEPLILLGLVFLLLLSAALLPPLGYDGHEYHLVVPAGYLQEHGWLAFPNNVYAGFPMNVEMIYLWPLSLGSSAGCTVINGLFAFIGALGVYCLLKQLSARDAWLGSYVFLTTGLVALLTLQADIDLSLSACGILLFLTYERYRKTGEPADRLMMAAILGFGLGCKYIAMISLLIPFALLVALDGLLSKRWALIRAGNFAIMGGFLLFAPWLIRNAILYHNPFYPLLYSIFGGTPEFFTDLFARAHAAEFNGVLPDSLDFLTRLIRKSVGPGVLPVGFSSLWLLGLPLLWLQRQNAVLWRMALFCGVIYIDWFFLTQRNDRFLATLLPFMTLLPVWALDSMPSIDLRKVLRGIIVLGGLAQLWAGFTFVFNDLTVGYIATPSLEADYFVKRMPHYRAIDWLNRKMAEGAPVGDVLFVGEAQTYGADFNAIAPTVFNHHPYEQGLPPSVTHVLYNGMELDRLRKGYGPLGWPLGSSLQAWIDQNKDKTLLPVFDAYPQSPGRVVVFEVRK